MAFHPYPQLIPSVFNLSGFGPPRRLTVASPWPWVDHSASGPEHTTTPPQRVDTPYSDSLSLRLPLHGLTSRHVPDSQAHSSKGTPSPHDKSRALTDCRHTVSGTLSLPSRGTFHHSLTVLIRYRSLDSIQAYRVVPADSQQIPRARCYSGTLRQQTACFRLRGSHPLRTDHPRPLHLTHCFITAAPIGGPKNTDPTTPNTQPPPGITCIRFSHPPLSLATTHGITLVFSSYGY